jgi:hypothetical protein
MDAPMRAAEKRKKANWVTKSNYPTLLNLAVQMLRFGPLRLLWGGRILCEGGLRFVKRFVYGLTKNWPVNSMKRFYRNKALHLLHPGDHGGDSIVVEGEGGEEEICETHGKSEETNIFNKKGRKLVKIFGGRAEAVNVFLSRKAVSVVAVEGEDNILNFGIPFWLNKKDKTVSVVPLALGSFKEEVFGAAYFDWNLRNSPDTPLNANKVKHICLLLPRLTPDGMPKMDGTGAEQHGQHVIFCAITNTWCELLKNKTIGLPQAMGASYR